MPDAFGTKHLKRGFSPGPPINLFDGHDSQQLVFGAAECYLFANRETVVYVYRQGDRNWE